MPRKNQNKPSYGELIREAQKIDKEIVDEEEDFVNICIKAPRRYRQHWQSKAKKEGTTVTKILTDALIKKWGLPDTDK